MSSMLDIWIRIEAPDAASAFALEQRLAHLHPTAVYRHEQWCVELEDVDDRREEIEAAVHHWLETQGLERTTMVVGDEAHAIVARAAAETAV